MGYSFGNLGKYGDGLTVEVIRAQFDPDIRGLVKVKIVHGSWRAEDQNRARLEVCCSVSPVLFSSADILLGASHKVSECQARLRIHARAFRHPPLKDLCPVPARRSGPVLPLHFFRNLNSTTNPKQG
jgi:hypothetical protein